MSGPVGVASSACWCWCSSAPQPGPTLGDDGPARPALQRRFPGAVFVGARTGEDLARHYAGADVFVFPSRTDTFGLVLLEAIASGLPVAAFPVPGPLDVIGTTGAGILSEDLRAAALGALAMGPVDPDRRLADYSWARCADVFEAVVTPITPAVPTDLSVAVPA